ncbi:MULTISPECIES: RraA family protein [Pantoea]|uniref:Putative 4-hydroxy-4-methyl-2-oxoglutarate aldolase n=1 Tax=Pantoea septica TaxID=472695 RepID=A0ABX3UMC6_9GAMM|nr:MULTISPECIES: dimethylmenaquinone methyltransferase [Pantoea]MDU5476117.1 RraA family protein [Pantoea sp.]ORM90855.1 dimethylmenaquinone methyltransferase [Pantoea septica]
MSSEDALLIALVNVETATIGHMISHGFMSPELQCILPDICICGPALTVSLPEDDGYSLPFALQAARKGDVLVIERLNDNYHACWGAVMTVAAQQVGIAAVILDGYITDISVMMSAQFPVWCKGRSPLTTKRGKTGGAVNTKITCAGVVVNPGDIILADENGVLSLSKEEMAGLLEQALEIQRQEPLIIEKLKQGISLADIYGL